MNLRKFTDGKEKKFKNRVFTDKAQQLLGVGRTFLMERKASGEFKVGVHWVYSSGKPKSRILWDIPEIQAWQEEQSKKYYRAAEKAAESIETFAEMGAI